MSFPLAEVHILLGIINSNNTTQRSVTLMVFVCRARDHAAAALIGHLPAAGIRRYGAGGEQARGVVGAYRSSGGLVGAGLCRPRGGCGALDELVGR